MKKYVALAALMAAVASPAAAQQMMAPGASMASPGMAMAAPMAVPLTPATYRQMAMISDSFEIQSSSLALERSRNPRIRNYAQTMISHHSATSQALMGGTGMAGGTTSRALTGAVVGGLVAGPVGAAVGAGVGATTAGATGAAQAGAGAGIPVAPLDSRHAAMLQQLANANGRQFDALYAQMQMMSHQEAFALHSTYAQAGTDPALRNFAAQAAPIVQEHLVMAQNLPGMRRMRQGM